MRRFIIHCSYIGGHQLEYIHHLYMSACEMHNDKFWFVVPSKYNLVKDTLKWPKAENVKILIMLDNEEPKKQDGLLKFSYINSKTLGKYVKLFKATHVVGISMMDYVPFLPLFVSPKVKVSGIIYRIYLYEWKHMSLYKRLQDIIKYYIMSRFAIYHSPYILNDTTSARYLNRLYNTDKFKFLTDPVSVSPETHGHDISKELGINDNLKIVLHPGGMLPYKGTLEILKAMSMMDAKELDRFVVIFAGQVTPYIKNEFDSLMKSLKDRAHIICMEGYLPFEKLADLFVTSDYILIPYKAKGQSSGIIGHAALYDRPVIAAKGGLISKLVKRWHLGMLLDNPTSDNIKAFLSDLPSLECSGERYVGQHTVSLFSRTLLS